ncbi:TetM/TetW/TetO/TetS family tetracycline resistance ribosomal protection protein [Micromonospora sp. WMMD718]|uniref:elongation factor G n=1 Tax=unclassified Micromonospora TaxID=2617518 RepID=UPI00064BA93D|nr:MULTISPECIES: TetM/TetW/TetO/TetS family tetracycline resistance ribosomal protection protein [unclassified Micromonospora]MDG4750965.1 TetM/TetW/TetO/TetS family tetracycline resistance ribosomal protection protein [Micromonospora sp. WMMD718]
MALLNLGIVAHVDAGKTSLTERLLYEAGAVAEPGSVDAGTTRTDSMELERRRGITIRAAVTSITIGDLSINLLDTPGHPDFIAEVERSLAVLDAAVLVVSSVEGVQPQTVAIWRALRRIGVPTVFFFNKVDRGGADVDRATAQVRQRLGARPVLLTTVTGQGSREALVHAVDLDAEPVVAEVAEVDDAVAARWLTDRPVRVRDVRRALRRAVRGAELVPAVCGSAITGAGVRRLSARIGQHIGDPPRRHGYRFPPPTRQAVVEPVDPAQRLAMFAGLAELADEDPLVDLRLDEQQAEAVIRLHGEVQKEVLAALMEDRYGVRVRFSGTLTACIERVAGTGAAEERLRERGNPYLAGLGLRIDAAPAGHGIEFRPGIEPGRLPPAFVAATEEGVRAALRQGRHGWPVTDCTVTMTASRYWPRQSRPHRKFDKSISTVAADFRNLAPVVVAAALRQAGTRVCQPIERFDVNLPRHAVETVLALLGRLGAVVHDTAVAGGYLEVSGTLPSARVPRVVVALPDLTGGEAVLTTTFDHYAPVTGEEPPTLPRRGPDPDDREAWFRAVPR